VYPIVEDINVAAQGFPYIFIALGVNAHEAGHARYACTFPPELLAGVV